MGCFLVMNNYPFPTPPPITVHDPLQGFSPQSYTQQIHTHADQSTYPSFYTPESDPSTFLDLDLSQPGPPTCKYPEMSTSDYSGAGEPVKFEAVVDGEQPLDGDNEEPLYVNAKQYHRILKRRIARQRLEELNRLSRSRKVS